MADSQWIWQPTREYLEQTNAFRFMRSLGFHRLEDFLRFSREDLEGFWGEIVKETGVEWFEPYEKVLDTSRGVEWARWFINGKLNIAYNCVDRHAVGPNADRAACIGESESGTLRSLTFGELHAQVNRLAHGLVKLGLQSGDRVAVYMPMIPEVVAILYACFKLGLIVVPVFSGFGPSAIASRIGDSGARLVFTADGAERRGKFIELKAKADAALDKAPSVEHVVVLDYLHSQVVWNPQRDIRWEDLVRDARAHHNSARLDSEDLALIVYTSGTTGPPKGTVHTHAGTLAQVAKEHYLAFDRRLQERLFWLSDIGWMMGPWAILGTHHFGGTIFLYDGAPDYPHADRLWEMIERHRITTFGLSPTAIRVILKKSGGRAPACDLSRLRMLGSTGEPWDESSYRWFFEKVGQRRCPIINISGGTEIAGSFVLPLPIQSLKPCSVGGPSPGMATEIFDERGKPVRFGKGFLVCTKPSPSMTRGLWKDPGRYLTAYWSRWKGVWFHGDWASVDEDGSWFLHGRADEAFNVAGRKVGPAEVEQALIGSGKVSEAAVIGVPDALTGERIIAFIVLKPGVAASPDLSQALLDHIDQTEGPTLRPHAIHVVAELPKTHSGKIVRRAIREVYLGQVVEDKSSLEDPGALERFRAAR